jgi:hypothetical protein
MNPNFFEYINIDKRALLSVNTVKQNFVLCGGGYE